MKSEIKKIWENQIDILIVLVYSQVARNKCEIKGTWENTLQWINVSDKSLLEWILGYIKKYLCLGMVAWGRDQEDSSLSPALGKNLARPHLASKPVVEVCTSNLSYTGGKGMRIMDLGKKKKLHLKRKYLFSYIRNKSTLIQSNHKMLKVKVQMNWKAMDKNTFFFERISKIDRTTATQAKREYLIYWNQESIPSHRNDDVMRMYNEQLCVNKQPGRDRQIPKNNTN
jgi:hypothetical protein